MYSVWLILVGGAIFVWLGILTYFAWKERNFLTALFPSSGERDIRKKFTEVLSNIDEFKVRLGENQKALENLVRVAIVRYNPYEDTGGDQSFSIALLSERGSGVVITSLHARSGTRVFAKPIQEGKAQKQQLSKEEQEVVSKAMERT